MSDDDRIEHRRPRTNRLKRSPGLQRTASIRLSPRIQEILSPASFGSFGSPRSPNTPRSYSHDKPIKSPRDGQFSPTGAEREPLNRMKSLETPSMARPGFSGKFSPDFYSRSHSMDSPTFSSLSGCHSRYITSPTRSMQYGTEGPPIEDILNTTSNSGDEFQRFAERKPLYVINPITSNFRKVWDIFLGFLIVYNVAVPFRLGFDVSGGLGLFIFDIATDALFIIDIFLNFRTAVETDGVLIDEPKMIAAHYLKSWFVVDLVSAFPVDLVLLGFGMNVTGSSQHYRINKLLKILKTFRLVRMLRLARLARIMARFRAIFNVKYSILTIGKFFAAVAFFAHWIACFWYLVASLQGIDDNSTWVSEMQMIGDEEKGTLHYESLRTKYIVCIYHAIMVMSTIGSHILPVTNAERVYSLLTMFVGSSIYAYGITNMCSLIFNLNRQEVEYKQRMDMINDFMHMRGLPPKLRNKVRHYYEHLHAKQRFFNEHEIIGELSRDLQNEVILRLNEKMIRKNDFFSKMSNKAVAAIIQRLDMFSFLPGENVVYEGERGQEMFFIYDGSLEVYLAKEQKALSTLNAGDYFGEIALMNPNCRRTASVRALTFSDVYALTKYDIDDVLSHFPKDRLIWTEALRSRLLTPTLTKSKSSLYGLGVDPETGNTDKKSWKKFIRITRKELEGNATNNEEKDVVCSGASSLDDIEISVDDNPASMVNGKGTTDQRLTETEMEKTEHLGVESPISQERDSDAYKLSRQNMQSVDIATPTGSRVITQLLDALQEERELRKKKEAELQEEKKIRLNKEAELQVLQKQSKKVGRRVSLV